MPLYLGLDASTQSLTAVIIEIGGHTRRIVFQHSLNFDRDLPEYRTLAGVRRGPDEGEVHAPPLMWVEALDRVMAAIATAADVDIDDIRAVSGSAQQHGSVYLNQTAPTLLSHLDPLAPLAPQLRMIFSRGEAPVWLDTSTAAQCAEITAAMGGEAAVRAVTGSPACERFTAAQIRKFHQRDPHLYDATARVDLVSSFLATLLIGEAAPVEPGDASGTNLMELAGCRWSPAALAATAPDLERRLPPIHPSSEIIGHLSSYWQRRYALPAAPVVAWSGDNPSSLVGTGLIRPGIVAVSLGTSDTVFAASAVPGNQASHVFRSPMGGFMNLVCFRNGSLTREAIRLQYRLDWNEVAALLEALPGNGGRIVLPWLEAEITPLVVNPGLRRIGFDASDAAGNVRGLIEGQMMAMANHATDVTSDPIDRLIATGGAAVNRALLQVMANVFGIDVYRLDVDNSAALGAALRAYHGERLAAGDSLSWPAVVAGFAEPHPGHRVTPNPKHVAVYLELRRRYAALEQRHRDGAAIG